MLALRSRSAIAALGAALSAIPLAVAHEHHHDGPADNSKPIDSVLWLHIGVQATTWAVLFPRENQRSGKSAQPACSGDDN